MSLHQVRSFEELDRKLDEAATLPTEKERIDVLCSSYLTLDGWFDFPADPFSEPYHKRAIELWSRLSGRNGYEPATHELSGYHSEVDMRAPPPYNVQSGNLLGDMLICWGFILRTLDLKPGRSILEYGPGSGQILLQFARMGVRTAGIDIDPVQTRFIREQGERFGLDIRSRVGEFGDTIEPGERYDAVLFFEAFHHALNHIALVDRLHDVVADDGVLVLAAEPILDPDSYFRAVVPFPWGPRLDLLSLRATRTHGWMELGFQEEYFMRLMNRGGWLVTRHHCSLTERATMWVSRKNHGTVTAGELLLPADEAATWHTPEGTHRWTRGRGVMTLDSRPRWSRVTVTVTNHSPKTLPVTLACGPRETVVPVEPGQTRPVTLALPGGTRRLEIRSSTFVPQQAGFGDDARELGVYVSDIHYS